VIGPVYRSWDEAMADPDLDPSKPWFVAPDAAPAKLSDLVDGWPDGWTELGYTDDGSAVYYRPTEPDG
jgi:hypothetical protein